MLPVPLLAQRVLPKLSRNALHMKLKALPNAPLLRYSQFHFFVARTMTKLPTPVNRPPKTMKSKAPEQNMVALAHEGQFPGQLLPTRSLRAREHTALLNIYITFFKINQ